MMLMEISEGRGMGAEAATDSDKEVERAVADTGSGKEGD